MSQPSLISAHLSNTSEFLTSADLSIHEDWLFQSQSSDYDFFDDHRFDYPEADFTAVSPFEAASPFESSSSSSYESLHASAFTSPSSLDGLTGTGPCFGIDTW